jgi:dihydrofolate reductase
MIKAILAHGLNGEIGQEEDMPWGRSLPKDLEYFKEQTIGQIVVMGNNTFGSLPFNLGLPYRDNVVLTSVKLIRDTYHGTGHCTEFLNSKEQVLQYHCEDDTLWLMGGATIYKQFWEHVTEAHITTVKQSYPEADTFFKPDLSEFEKVGEEIDVGNGELEASVQVWRRK